MKTQALLVLIILMFFLPGKCTAQQTGEVNYPALGIRFAIPDGWKGAESGEVFLIASDITPGLVIILPHEESQLSTLRSLAEEGIRDEGIDLKRTGDIQQVGAEGIGAEFSGTIQGTKVKAYVVGVINPFGMGVLIMATTDDAHYSSMYKQLAEEIALSLKFSEPKESAVSTEWRSALTGAKLTYMKSNYSGGSSYGGYSTYSGYSFREEILLCSSQQFSYSTNNSMSMDSGGAFGSSGGKESGTGTWKVTSDSAGNSILELHFSDGTITTYQLSFSNQKTYLNGTRYYRTYDHGLCN